MNMLYVLSVQNVIHQMYINFFKGGWKGREAERGRQKNIWAFLLLTVKLLWISKNWYCVGNYKFLPEVDTWKKLVFW